MDMEKVDVYRAGNNIKLGIKMVNPVSTVWNPKNGFDHVVYSIYIGLPDGAGASYMPLQNARIKDGMKWDYLVFIAGWNNAVYSSLHSAKDNYGTPVGPSPKIDVDLKNRTVNVSISAKTIGNPDHLEGTKIYITTWDYDGMESKYRPLKPKAEPFSFGGGTGSSPYIMDDTEIILIN
jgi:hypothetical protein